MHFSVETWGDCSRASGCNTHGRRSGEGPADVKIAVREGTPWWRNQHADARRGPLLSAMSSARSAHDLG
eukprot:7386661-Prymnesium_polylepis.1